MALVTFLGTPSMTFYRGSCAGCVETWLPGEVRDLDNDVAVQLLQDFPGAFMSSLDAFEVAPATKTAAVKAPKRKAPAAKTRAAKPKKGKA